MFATAFDEAADVFLQHTPIDFLHSMENADRHIFGTKLVFENYYVRLVSKVDNEGRIKHIIAGRPEQWSLEEQSRVNLKMVEELRKAPSMVSWEVNNE